MVLFLPWKRIYLYSGTVGFRFPIRLLIKNKENWKRTLQKRTGERVNINSMAINKDLLENKQFGSSRGIGKYRRDAIAMHIFFVKTDTGWNWNFEYRQTNGTTAGFRRFIKILISHIQRKHRVILLFVVSGGTVFESIHTGRRECTLNKTHCLM